MQVCLRTRIAVSPDGGARPPTNSSRTRLRRQLVAGQVAAEVAVGLATIIAALVFMALYARQGMQGSLKQASDAHGIQFHPDHNYSDQRWIDENKVKVRQVSTASMVSADILGQGNWVDDADGDRVWADPDFDQGDLKMMLKSLPTGPVLRETTTRRSQVNTTSKISEDGDFNRF